MKLERMCDAPNGHVDNFEFKGHTEIISWDSDRASALLGVGTYEIIRFESYWCVFVYDSGVWLLSGSNIEDIIKFVCGWYKCKHFTDDMFATIQAMLI